MVRIAKEKNCMITKQRSAIERRTEPRCDAAGEVRLCHPYMPRDPFVGRLVDIAASGFRARHHQFTLSSGDLVDYAFEQHQGGARAMWTRIIGEEVETGFRICQES